MWKLLVCFLSALGNDLTCDGGGRLAAKATYWQGDGEPEQKKTCFVHDIHQVVNPDTLFPSRILL